MNIPLAMPFPLLETFLFAVGKFSPPRISAVDLCEYPDTQTRMFHPGLPAGQIMERVGPSSS